MEATTTAGQRIERRALQEDTVCGAFQATVADNADRTAVRTKGDEFSITWAEYGDRVRKLAAGPAGPGPERGPTIAPMLTKPPRVHPLHSPAGDPRAPPASPPKT